ncbi:MAG TPA: PQQ-binding-like beta-propeller repeat protein [Verrucomicrobiae bacterium]|nr:PQQ-binding-like beta-propeller repeat protein [Verrucomicrobiae bacterium]
MKRFILILLATSVISNAESKNWPAFRGPDAQGIGDGKTVLTWNADKTEGPIQNIRWSTDIPGLSHASPTIWGDRLFVTSAISGAGEQTLKMVLHDNGAPSDDVGEQTWIIYCLDKNTGKILWQRVATKNPPKTKRHPKSSHANATTVTDGKRLIVFLGSEGVYSYDLDGNLLWKKDLGVFDAGPFGYADLQWGTASSPVLFEDKIVLQCDQKAGSFLVVLSAKDGSEIWRTAREKTSTQSWATPAIVRTAERTQIVTNGWPYMAGYDLATGKELWRLKHDGDLPAATPVFANGLIYIVSSHGGGQPLFAIFPSATGDITPPQGSTESPGLAWYVPRNVQETMVTPLLYGGLLYCIADNGVLKTYDAMTGKLTYIKRVGAGVGFSASPIVVDSKIFFTSEDGEVYVVKAGTEFEILAKNLMGETVLASPAFSEDVLFFRTRGRVVAIGAAAGR